MLNLIYIMAAIGCVLSSFVPRAASLNTKALNIRAGFKCPTGMVYSPWARACTCLPGQTRDSSSNTCHGQPRNGPWPPPPIDKYAGVVSGPLSKYCAKSPTQSVEYDVHHPYCQASVNTIAFAASADLGIALNAQTNNGNDNKIPKKKVDKTIQNTGIAKDVQAALSGLYIENVEDAVALFNTNKYGLGVKNDGGLGSLVADVVTGLGCLLSLGGKCANKDCVSNCTAGCANFLDPITGDVGDLLGGLSGLCIGQSVVQLLNSTGGVVSKSVDGLLCTVGKLLSSLLSTFNCSCTGKAG